MAPPRVCAFSSIAVCGSALTLANTFMKNHLAPLFRVSLAALAISILSAHTFAAATNNPAPSFSYSTTNDTNNPVLIA
ncbi:MAG TPA: hypothetical protein VJ476_02370, partial [Rhizomicrobium sp.]|nr:hypothetical protein [Rhizomicrobium sp.]